MANNDIYDLIVIGGGPGGLSAGIYAMRAALKTVLIEKAVPGGQVAMSAEVENYLGFERIEGAELSMKFSQPFFGLSDSGHRKRVREKVNPDFCTASLASKHRQEVRR